MSPSSTSKRSLETIKEICQWCCQSLSKKVTDAKYFFLCFFRDFFLWLLFPLCLCGAAANAKVKLKLDQVKDFFIWRVFLVKKGFSRNLTWSFEFFNSFALIFSLFSRAIYFEKKHPSFPINLKILLNKKKHTNLFTSWQLYSLTSKG